MKIAFFGAAGSFDYFKIGGTESFSRRLAHGLVAAGHQVDFVMSGSPTAASTQVDAGIGLYNFATLPETLDFLAGNYDHILTMYLQPRDRFRYLWFRRAYRDRLQFHQIYVSWPDSPIKRHAAFLDARLYPFNGCLICISPRQFEYTRRWCRRTILLLPPVAENYFLDLADKPKNDLIKITYIGRTESGKGIDEAINLFTKLKDRAEVRCEIHGLYHQNAAASKKMHEWLLHQQDGIRYFYIPWEGYSPAVDDNLRGILRQTDILVLPYARLSSTIDTPMLLLEGMASLCAVIVPGFGNIPDIYGPSPFIYTSKGQIAETVNRVLDYPEILAEERNRILQRNNELGFNITQTTRRLLEAIS